jgi:hypothetical protein
VRTTKPNADKVGACALSPVGVGCTARPESPPSASGVRVNVHHSCHRVNPGVRGDREPPAVVLPYIANDDEWEAPVWAQARSVRCVVPTAGVVSTICHLISSFGGWTPSHLKKVG